MKRVEDMKKVPLYVDSVLLGTLDIKEKTTRIGGLRKAISQQIGDDYRMSIMVDGQELRVGREISDKKKLKRLVDLTKEVLIVVRRIVPHGKIRIAQQARAKAYPVVPGFEVVPAWSRGAGEWCQLSPFYITFENGVIFENFWQSFKVWERVDKQKSVDWNWPAEVHVDANGNPNEAWFKWHNALLTHKRAVRRPNGRAVPLYAYWNGQKLNTVEARKQIYIPYLKQLYRQHRVYRKLLEKVRSGVNVILVEPDGPLLDVYPQGQEMDLPLLYRLVDVMNYATEGRPEKYRPYGHGYVLAACILEDLEQ